MKRGIKKKSTSKTRAPLPFWERRSCFETAQDLFAASRGFCRRLDHGTLRLGLDRNNRNHFFVGGKETAGFLGVFAKDVEAEEVGGTGLGAGAGHDGDDFARPHEAALFEEAFGE